MPRNVQHSRMRSRVWAGRVVRVAKAAFTGALGVDCVTVIANKAMADGLYAHGFTFACRYLGSLSSSEVDVILESGMALMPVTYSRNPGWLPSAALGGADGNQAVSRCMAAGIPKGVTVWLDLEGPGGHAADVIDWVNAWADVVKSAGYDPGLYCGYGTLLTSHELYMLHVDRYWHSVSRVTDSAGQLAEPACGWSMIQLNPSVMRAGVWVDVDVIQEDYQKRLPTWCVKAP